ncbi:MAG: hypothetical protein EA366_02045 [Spirulina sp. DLM2.Bin59]|nr:MAG: hypothetical protein EA366_02045 [Spirulina sp. DLM2.Bin59]
MYYDLRAVEFSGQTFPLGMRIEGINLYDRQSGHVIKINPSRPQESAHQLARRLARVSPSGRQLPHKFTVWKASRS